MAGRGHPIDRDELHRYLWEKADTKGMLELHQGEFAEQLGCNFGTVYRIFKELAQQGKLEKLGGGGRMAIGRYRITQPGDAPPKRRQISWG